MSLKRWFYVDRGGGILPERDSTQHPEQYGNPRSLSQRRLVPPQCDRISSTSPEVCNFISQVDPPYSIIISAGVGPPYTLAKLGAGERCWLPDQAEPKAVRMPHADPPYSCWLVKLNP
jgi:hypothetical protein